MKKAGALLAGIQERDAGGTIMTGIVLRRRPRRPVRRLPLPMALLVAALAVSVVSMTVHLFRTSDANRAKAAVERFYAFEQSGDFGSSWELFHSRMKARFAKDAYIQARAYIFMQQLGVRTFTFEIGKAERLSAWRTEEGGDVLTGVYRMPVIQRMDTVFGTMELKQIVHVARDDGEWKLLWPYGEEE